MPRGVDSSSGDDARVDAAVQLLISADTIDDRVIELVDGLLVGRPQAVREHVFSIARQTRALMAAGDTPQVRH